MKGMKVTFWYHNPGQERNNNIGIPQTIMVSDHISEIIAHWEDVKLEYKIPAQTELDKITVDLLEVQIDE